LALDYCEVAKKADKSECYRAALSYYEGALESFLNVLKSLLPLSLLPAINLSADSFLSIMSHTSLPLPPEESNPQIKTSLRETVAVYMERAEKIKEFLLKSPDYKDPVHIPPPSQSKSASLPSASSATSSGAPSGGPSPYGPYSSGGGGLSSYGSGSAPYGHGGGGGGGPSPYGSGPTPYGPGSGGGSGPSPYGPGSGGGSGPSPYGSGPTPYGPGSGGGGPSYGGMISQYGGAYPGMWDQQFSMGGGGGTGGGGGMPSSGGNWSSVSAPPATMDDRQSLVTVTDFDDSFGFTDISKPQSSADFLSSPPHPPRSSFPVWSMDLNLLCDRVRVQTPWRGLTQHQRSWKSQSSSRHTAPHHSLPEEAQPRHPFKGTCLIQSMLHRSSWRIRLSVRAKKCRFMWNWTTVPIE